MLEELSVEMTQVAPFHTVGRSSEQRGTIVAQGRKNTGASSSGGTRSIASFWPTIRRRRSCSSFPASSPVCAVSNSSFKWPYSWPVLVPSRQAFNHILTFVLSTRGSKNRTPILGGEAAGPAECSPTATGAKMQNLHLIMRNLPNNAQSADPRRATAGSSALRSGTTQLRRCAISKVAFDFRLRNWANVQSWLAKRMAGIGCCRGQDPVMPCSRAYFVNSAVVRMPVFASRSTCGMSPSCRKS